MFNFVALAWGAAFVGAVTIFDVMFASSGLWMGLEPRDGRVTRRGEEYRR
jgi:hypothetical protein